MHLKKIILLASAATLAVSASGQILAFWDFNDEAVTSTLVNTPFTFAPNAGSQLTAELSMVLADTASAQTFGVLAEGTTVNDLVNDPAVAGNAFAFSRGERSNGATMSVAFDASSINQPVSLSFAINRVVANGVSAYQASYSTDGGTSFTNIGSLQSIAQGTWATHEIDFGTVFAGADEAIVRLTFSGGVQNWSTDHRTNVDNIALIAIPEPRVYAALFGLLALGFVAWRRRR
ncbi:MAG: PEP-CTERM sorting domain-containing protein [Opitutales bacterium]|nr:PEP-CTERM sorting domain-containing protein [Opitutales bacterium]